MALAGDLADGADRVLIGCVIALGVGEGARRFAEHVEAGGEARILALAHALDRFVDGAAHDEDLAHHPHRRADRLADEGLADAADQPLQRRSPRRSR